MRTRLVIPVLACSVVFAAACVPGPGTPTTPSPGGTTSAESCNGRIGAVSVEKVNVPQGARCTLEGTKVKGNVFVRTNATLVASGVSVGGNIQAENAGQVTMTGGSRVVGSVQVKQGGGSDLRNSSVNGDIQLESNRRFQNVQSNIVGGSIQVFQNTGGASITGNRVDGNLQCKENAPAPTGGGNVVQGNKEDQCSRL